MPSRGDRADSIAVVLVLGRGENHDLVLKPCLQKPQAFHDVVLLIPQAPLRPELALQSAAAQLHLMVKTVLAKFDQRRMGFGRRPQEVSAAWRQAGRYNLITDRNLTIDKQVDETLEGVGQL